MKKGTLVISIAIVIVFVATFTIFYIVDSLNKLAAECERGAKLEICEKLSSFSFQMIIILILIGGLVSTISAVGYLLLSTLSK